MDYKEFFSTDNAGGHKANEKYLKTHFNELYCKIIAFIENNISLSNLSFKQKIWHFINDTPNIPACKECNAPLSFGRSIKEGYPKYCSIECTNANAEHIKNVKETVKRKYGITCSVQIPNIKNKPEAIEPINSNSFNDIKTFIIGLNIKITEESNLIIIQEKRLAITVSKYATSELINSIKLRGFQLINISEEDWSYKQEIVESIIRLKLGIFENKISSDDCIIKKIGIKEKRAFLIDNYIGGDCNEDIRLGLYYKEELILVSTFLKGAGGDYEMLLFSQKLNHMTTHYNPNKITTTVDLKYNNGNLFIKYGFIVVEASDEYLKLALNPSNRKF
jgi:hypothetical protein